MSKHSVPGNGDHGQAAVLKLLQRELVLLLLGQLAVKVRGVERPRARLPLALAPPEVARLARALDDADGQDDLGNALRVRREEVVEVLRGVGLKLEGVGGRQGAQWRVQT